MGQRRITAVLWLLGLVVLLVMCSGVLTPTVTAIGAAAWTTATWAWAWVIGSAVLLGPALLLWAFVKGPPRRGDTFDGMLSLGLVVVGVALTIGLVRYLPLVLVLVATLFTLPWM